MCLCASASWTPACRQGSAQQQRTISLVAFQGSAESQDAPEPVCGPRLLEQAVSEPVAQPAHVYCGEVPAVRLHPAATQDVPMLVHAWLQFANPSACVKHGPQNGAHWPAIQQVVLQSCPWLLHV